MLVLYVNLQRVFWTRLAFKWMNFEWSRLLSLLWVGLTPSVEGLSRTETSLPGREEILWKAASGLRPHHSLSWMSSLLASGLEPGEPGAFRKQDRVPLVTVRTPGFPTLCQLCTHCTAKGGALTFPGVLVCGLDDGTACHLGDELGAFSRQSL